MAKVKRKGDRTPVVTYRTSRDDISNVKADAVVVSEAPCLDKDSLVAQSLMAKIPMFRERRLEFKKAYSFLYLWTVKHSYLGSTFKYVIHAVMDKGNNEIWFEEMKTLYHRIFKEAENLKVSTIALPLLGTGLASVDRSMAARVLVASVLSYPPRAHLSIIVVSKDKAALDETETQFTYQRRYPEQEKGLLKRASMAFKEIFDSCPHRDAMPPKRGTENKGFSTDKEQKQRRKPDHALNNYRSEMEEAKRISRLEMKDRGYKEERYPHKSSSHSFSKEDSELQRAIELSKREAGARTAPCTSPDPTPTPRDDTDMGIEVTCPICLCCISDPKQLDKCGHLFCRACIDRSFLEYKPVCPSCNMVYGEIRGNQPDGQMDVGFSGEHLPGYEGHGTITITYRFPNGWQKEGDPSPGRPYKGTTRRAYLPNNKEGKEILALLRTSFKRRLTFTIGRSTTTGKEGVVTWNDIHHKTSIDGGPTRFGYPDPTYLSRVRDELASKGVTNSTEKRPAKQQIPVKEKDKMTLKALAENSQRTNANLLQKANTPHFNNHNQYVKTFHEAESRDTTMKLDNQEPSLSQRHDPGYSVTSSSSSDESEEDDESQNMLKNRLDSQEPYIHGRHDPDFSHEAESRDTTKKLDNQEPSLSKRQDPGCSVTSSVSERLQTSDESEEDDDSQNQNVLKNRLDSSEQDIHGRQDRGRSLSSCEKEESDGSEKEADNRNISKERHDSPGPGNEKIRNPDRDMLSSVEEGHQKHQESAEQDSDSENNIKIEIDTPVPDVSKAFESLEKHQDSGELRGHDVDAEDCSILENPKSYCDVKSSVEEGHQQIDETEEHKATEQMVVLKDSETTQSHNLMDEVKGNANVKDTEKVYVGDTPEIADRVCEVKESCDGSARKPEDSNPDKPTHNQDVMPPLTQDCWQLSEGTGCTEAEEGQRVKGENFTGSPDLFRNGYMEPSCSFDKSFDTQSDSSDSIVVIDAPEDNTESFENIFAGEPFTENIEPRNQNIPVVFQRTVEVNESSNSFVIIPNDDTHHHDIEDDEYQIPDVQADCTSSEKSMKASMTSQTSSEEQQAELQESHQECVDSVDGNTNSTNGNKPVNQSFNAVPGVSIGNQPDGQMDVGFSGEHLPGYEGHGTITITYYFPSGTQGVNHPNPGQPYKGTTRRAYLPDFQEGRVVLRLLQKAFTSKLTFKVGPSPPPGQDNVVTWNDIPHKTNKDGGSTRFGYPDAEYLKRVREELLSKGLTD